MVNIIRFLVLSSSALFSINIYSADDLNTPSKKLALVEKWDDEFKKVGKQVGYVKKYASGEMDSIIDQINGQQRITQKVNSSITDPETGSKYKVSASVTKPVDNAKVAKTLASRLEKAKTYAKNLGKASIPTFLGMAAFEGLMSGIGWIIEDSGTVKRSPNPENINPSSQQYVWFWLGSDINHYESYQKFSGSTPSQACATYPSSFWTYDSFTYQNDTSVRCLYKSTTNSNQTLSQYYSYQRNPHYDSSITNENVEVTKQELEQAISNALSSNNASLANSISDAIRSAYKPDTSEGQDLKDTDTNGLASSSNNDISSALKNASTSQSGSYTITDGEKTVQGNVNQASQTGTTEGTNTQVDPVTGNPVQVGTSTGSISLPAFCNWASIVCDWIGWTKEEAEEPDIKPVLEEIEIPYAPFTVSSFNAACPPDQEIDITVAGVATSITLPMTPFCDFFSALRPFVIALASFFAVRLIGTGNAGD